MAKAKDMKTKAAKGVKVKEPKVKADRVANKEAKPAKVKDAKPKAKGELAKAVETELIFLLDGGHAHASFEAAVKDFPVKLLGVVPKGLPYSGWQIVEHLRLAQKDMLEFSDNAKGTYKGMKWPDDYWPKETAPANEKAWKASLAAIQTDRKAFVKLLKDADKAALISPFAWEKGQNLLKEALQLADHNAYHTGELIVVRRLLGCWK